jgi:hypothetical protein
MLELVVVSKRSLARVAEQAKMQQTRAGADEDEEEARNEHERGAENVRINGGVSLVCHGHSGPQGGTGARHSRRSTSPDRLGHAHAHAHARDGVPPPAAGSSLLPPCGPPRRRCRCFLPSSFDFRFFLAIWCTQSTQVDASLIQRGGWVATGARVSVDHERRTTTHLPAAPLDPNPNPKSVVTCGTQTVRFTLLTSRLVRMEVPTPGSHTHSPIGRVRHDDRGPIIIAKRPTQGRVRWARVR